LNAYEKVFLGRIAKLNISPGPDFAALTREALEREWGGQVVALLAGISQKTLESPKKFASALYKTYGDGAMKYFAQIVRYAESGKFHSGEDEESKREERDLESIIQEIGANPDENAVQDFLDEL
jgi:hypothetical protein